MIRQFTVLCCWLLACSLATAEVYKWVDENGKVRFSDKAPAEKEAENIAPELEKTNVDHAISQHASSAAYSGEKTTDEKELEARKRQQLEQAIGKHCRKLKADIASIAAGERGIFIDENGNEELVLERDRGKKLEEWRALYRESRCEELYPLEQQ